MRWTVWLRSISAAAVLIAWSARDARCQTVADVLTFLVTNTNQSVRTGSIERDRDAAQATSDTMSRALLFNLATLPVTTSSSAFVYRLNPELGTVERITQSFGPFFVERALTAGAGQASFGLTFQHHRFVALDGAKLRDGSLVTTANQFTDQTRPFEVDRLTLNIDADVATLYGNVGLTRRLEVGVAAPLIALRLEGTRVSSYTACQSAGRCEPERTFTQAGATATAIGLADLVVRTKYTLYDEEGAGLAAAVDVRLPTGRREDLLGAGSRSVKVAAIGSAERGRVTSHANAGVSFGGLARELSYGGALAVAASGRVTISGELLGRWIDTSGHIIRTTAPHPRLTGVETIRLTADTSTLHVVSVVPGVKWNLTNTWVLATNVAVPLTRGGLTSPFTPFVGLDYAFGR